MRSFEILVCKPRTAPSSIGDGLAETDDEKLHDAVQKPNTHKADGSAQQRPLFHPDMIRPDAIAQFNSTQTDVGAASEVTNSVVGSREGSPGP